MRIFIDFWKLETENSFLHVFSFLHKLSFENSFYFVPILSCQTSFLVSKIEIFFWKQKIRKKKKNCYQTYPKFPIWLLSQKKKKKTLNFPLWFRFRLIQLAPLFTKLLECSKSIWESIEKYIFQSRAYSIILFTSVEKALNVRLFYCFSSYVSESNWKYAL